MLPILIHLGPVVIRSYGVFLVLAFLTGTFILWREGQKSGYNEEKLLDLAVQVIFFGFLGSRLYYILTEFSHYSTRIGDIVQFWKGGFSLHGALIGGLIGFGLFVRKNKWPFFQVADFAILAVLLALMVGKIGSFLNGDDYGVSSDLPWAVQIPGVIGRRHPSPVYEIGILLVTYFFLLKKYREKQKSGGIFFSGLLLLGLGRLFTETFRDNPTYILGIKEGYVGAILLVLSGACGLYWFYNQASVGQIVGTKLARIRMLKTMLPKAKRSTHEKH